MAKQVEQKAEGDLRILSLTVNSFMGIKLAEVELDGEGGLVIIGGKNRQGKTSLINAIQFAIQGNRALPEMPVKKGEESAELILDLGDLKIRKIIKPDGTVKLTVTNADGFRPTNPQALLNSLAGSISFDPVAFKHLDPKKQLELVRELAGVDTRQLDKDAMATFEDRKMVNARVKAMEGEIGAMPTHKGVGYTEVSVAELSKQLSEAQAENRVKYEALTAYRNRKGQADMNRENIRERRGDLEAAKKRLAEQEAAMKESLSKLAKLDELLEVARVEAEEMPEIECDALHAAIEEAEATNKCVGQNVAYRERDKDLGKLSLRAAKMTEQLKDLATQKRDLIASANLPLEGLSFSDAAGVTLNGIPFDQLSAAESLAASVAIGAAMDPRLKVMLIRDGSLLDDDAMKLLEGIAKTQNYQLWVERVGASDAGAIVIEDGEVVGAAKED